MLIQRIYIAGLQTNAYSLKFGLIPTFFSPIAQMKDPSPLWHDSHLKESEESEEAYEKVEEVDLGKEVLET